MSPVGLTLADPGLCSAGQGEMVRLRGGGDRVRWWRNDEDRKCESVRTERDRHKIPQRKKTCCCDSAVLLNMTWSIITAAEHDFTWLLSFSWLISLHILRANTSCKVSWSSRILFWCYAFTYMDLKVTSSTRSTSTKVSINTMHMWKHS